jgi:hypothetical protein
LSKLDAAISLIECALDGLPKTDRDGASLRAAIRILMAAGRVDRDTALEMVSKGQEDLMLWGPPEQADAIIDLVDSLPNKRRRHYINTGKTLRSTRGPKLYPLKTRRGARA